MGYEIPPGSAQLPLFHSETPSKTSFFWVFLRRKGSFSTPRWDLIAHWYVQSQSVLMGSLEPPLARGFIGVQLGYGWDMALGQKIAIFWASAPPPQLPHCITTFSCECFNSFKRSVKAFHRAIGLILNACSDWEYLRIFANICMSGVLE